MTLVPEKLPCLGYELATMPCDIFSNSSEVGDQILKMTIYRFHNMMGGDGDSGRGPRISYALNCSPYPD
jgi:hypothetical protein